jgi:hypothetical protein
VGHAAVGAAGSLPWGAVILSKTFCCAMIAAPSEASLMSPATLPPVTVLPAFDIFSFPPV